MKALQGYRLIDLTHMLSGPYAGMMLADLGMETIKVEPPGVGEGTRRLLEKDPLNSFNGMGAYFLTLNRNKQSITLNLKDERGLAVFYDLVKHADVVLDNFSAGVPARLKIDHAALSAINPRIVTCSITGFGEQGPLKDYLAFDMVAQAMGGGMSITGQVGSPPTRAGIPIGDIGGGLMATIGVLAALSARATTGVGQHVDISMLDTQISLLNYMATMHLLSGEIPGPLGNAHFVHVPYDTYPTSDGWIIIAVIKDEFWKGVIEVTGLHELDTPEHERQPGRLGARELIDGKLKAALRENSSAYWLEQLRAARVPCAPVNNFAQALTQAQVQHRGMVVEVPQAAGGSVQMPGNPVKLSAHEDQYVGAPMLGQHTEAVLKGLLGKSDAELQSLRDAGVI